MLMRFTHFGHAARFAERRLQRSGRCHESEIRAALGREFTRYRNPETLSDSALRDMIRNWHRGADRTATGWAVLPRWALPCCIENLHRRSQPALLCTGTTRTCRCNPLWTLSRGRRRGLLHLLVLRPGSRADDMMIDTFAC